MQRAIQFLKRHFGAKEWAALGASVTLIVIVSWLLTQAHGLEEIGYAGGFLAMLLGSATVILPAPGLAVVAALGASVASPLLLGIASGAGAALGEITGYLAGYGGHRIIEEQRHYRAIKRAIDRYGFWSIMALAIIPNPFFDVAGIIAGATKYPFGLFLTATFIGKVIKCIAVAYAGATTLRWLLG